MRKLGAKQNDKTFNRFKIKFVKYLKSAGIFAVEFTCGFKEIVEFVVNDVYSGIKDLRLFCSEFAAFIEIFFKHPQAPSNQRILLTMTVTNCLC